MTSSLAAAWRWLWNSVLAPIIRFVLNGFASIVGGISNMLNVLSNIPGFGWAKTAADKMAGAADKAHDLAAGIRNIPDNKNVTVSINAVLTGGRSVAKGLGGSGGMTRAHGGPVTAGMPYIVGDGGRPEWFVPDQNGTIIPRVPSVPKMFGSLDDATPAARAAAVGGGSPAGDGAASAELLAEVQALRADVRKLPRDYQTILRQNYY